MKKLYVLMLLLPYMASTQALLPKNKKGEIEFTEVVKIDSTPASTLFLRGKRFASEGLNDVHNVSLQTDPSSDEIVVEGFLPVYVTTNQYLGDVQFVLKIDCMDENYSYSVNNLNHYYIKAGKYLSGGNLQYDEPLGILSRDLWKKVKMVTADKINTLITNVKRYMEKENENQMSAR